MVTLEDITKQVKDAATDKMKPAEALEKRNAAIARIEKACAEKNHTVCSVVKLSSGERYDLYQYKRYADIRLVFAPEAAAASFGGNPSELTYPRYSMDFAFLRAYENDQPAVTAHYFKRGARQALKRWRRRCSRRAVRFPPPAWRLPLATHLLSNFGDALFDHAFADPH